MEYGVEQKYSGVEFDRLLLDSEQELIELQQLLEELTSLEEELGKEIRNIDSLLSRFDKYGIGLMELNDLYIKLQGMRGDIRQYIREIEELIDILFKIFDEY